MGTIDQPTCKKVIANFNIFVFYHFKLDSAICNAYGKLNRSNLELLSNSESNASLVKMFL